MAFSDLIIQHENVLESDFCDHIIDKFEKDQSKQAGRTGNGVDILTKVSTDLFISNSDNWKEEDNKLFKALNPHLIDYFKLLQNFHQNESSSRFDITKSINDTGYQIQRTEPNGFYTWHDDFDFTLDNDKTYYRIGTYIFYLNTISENSGGRTRFRFMDNTSLDIRPKKGSLILFPANVLYPHSGEKLKDGLKYIITGWITVLH